VLGCAGELVSSGEEQGPIWETIASNVVRSLCWRSEKRVDKKEASLWFLWKRLGAALLAHSGILCHAGRPLATGHGVSADGWYAKIGDIHGPPCAFHIFTVIRSIGSIQLKQLAIAVRRACHPAPMT
jgi:hypothetical protein